MFVLDLAKRGNSLTASLETVMLGIGVAVAGAALATSACGSPPAQQSGIVAVVAVSVGGPPPGISYIPPHVRVNLSFQSGAQPIITRQVLTDAAGVTLRVELQPGQYQAEETFGHGLAPC
jgi:hypothetical protein